MFFNRLAIILTVFFFNGCARADQAQANKVCHEKKCFIVEIADTDETRARGLKNREVLEEGRGMLFIFPANQPHRFWMKDTLISLDMVWLDYARRIVHIEHNVPPCRKDPCPSYGPDEPALYVLELNAGTSAKFEMSEGDVLDFKLAAAH